jgi:hypothetical protein
MTIHIADKPTEIVHQPATITVMGKDPLHGWYLVRADGMWLLAHTDTPTTLTHEPPKFHFDEAYEVGTMIVPSQQGPAKLEFSNLIADLLDKAEGWVTPAALIPCVKMSKEDHDRLASRIENKRAARRRIAL